MTASTSDLFMKLGGSSSLVNSPKVTSARAGGVTTLAVDNCNWDQTTGKIFATYQVDTSNKVISGTEIIWKGIVTSTTSIGSLTRVAGASDTGNSIGDIVELLPASAWGNNLITGILTQHNQDGTHGAVTATSVTSSGTITGQGDVQLRSVSLETIKSETQFDFVASGCVISADAAGSTLNWSMSSGVVYIGGKRVVVNALSAIAATASKDTYVDVDNTGTVTYTGGNVVSNNATSPALAANSIRLGIIVSGAGNIAAATSINQGQENRVLPIASSIPYAVTDSLGNLICPRDPNRKLLGYRQILSTFTTTSGTAVQVTGLSCPVIVPTGRKVKIKLFCGLPYNTTSGAFNTFSIWDGVVGVGTRIQQTDNYVNTGNTGNNSVPEIVVTPTSASKTYNAGLQVNTGTGGIQAQTIQPAFISVELA